MSEFERDYFITNYPQDIQCESTGVLHHNLTPSFDYSKAKEIEIKFVFDFNCHYNNTTITEYYTAVGKLLTSPRLHKLWGNNYTVKTQPSNNSFTDDKNYRNFFDFSNLNIIKIKQNLNIYVTLPITKSTLETEIRALRQITYPFVPVAFTII